MNEKLEPRVKLLEDLVSKLCESHTMDLSIDLKGDALVMALTSIVCELAGREGVDATAFDLHLKARERWWQDYYLRCAEDVNAGVAADIDQRSVEQADVGEVYPSIFDPPPPPLPS